MLDPVDECQELLFAPAKNGLSSKRKSSTKDDASGTCELLNAISNFILSNGAVPLTAASASTSKPIQYAKIQCMHFLEYFYLKLSVTGITWETCPKIEWSDDEEKRDSWRRDLEKVLERKEKWIKIDDVDLVPACPAGENFGADVFRVVVYGRRFCLGAWTDIRKNFIVKRVPDPSSPCHWFYNCLRMFQNEIAAYEYILPMCQNYLDKKSRNEINELCFPKYYGQTHNFMVLQDLQTEGYQLVNRVKGFSVKECSLVLQELSKFHAVSFAVKQDDRVSFSKNIDKLKEVVFRDEHIHDLTGVFWENSAKFALKSVEESGDPRFRRASEILKFYSGQILRTIIDLIRPDFSKFEVLCHGDLWSNNILLRYCESGYPIGVKFIDLQTMRYSSCVLDVMHVLFTSSRPVIYERHFDLLLSEYYCSLVMNLKNLEIVPNFTFDEFMTEFKRKISFGVFLACLMFTCVTRTSPQDPPEVKLTKKDLTSESEFQKMYKALSPGYHERLHALFLALTDSNLI